MAPRNTMDLWTGKYITEASGKRRIIRNGQKIISFVSFGSLELRGMDLTHGDMDQVREPFSCGEKIGAGFDATPEAMLYGPCVLIGIEGTGTTFLQSLTLIWSCMGVPDYFY